MFLRENPKLMKQLEEQVRQKAAAQDGAKDAKAKEAHPVGTAD